MTVSTWNQSWAAAWGGSWGWTRQLEIGRRSGVVRLWLAQLTAELNGMIEKETPEAPKEAVPVVLEQITENADGSVTVGVEKPARRVKKRVADTQQKPFSAPKHPIDVEKFKIRELPPPEEFASFIFGMLTVEARSQVWAEEKVLEALRQAAEEHEEEEMLIEAAVQFMF